MSIPSPALSYDINPKVQAIVAFGALLRVVDICDDEVFEALQEAQTVLPHDD